MEQTAKTTGIKVLGIGRYVPELIATNDDFAKIVETSDEWITQRTGIKTRIANDPQTCVIRGMGKILKAPKLLERNGYYFKTRQELVGYDE